MILLQRHYSPLILLHKHFHLNSLHFNFSAATLPGVLLLEKNYHLVVLPEIDSGITFVE